MIGKTFLPKSLFGRALLILILPTVLTQLLMAYIFFDRHWDNVTRHLSEAFAGDVALIIDQLKTIPESHRAKLIKDFEEDTSTSVNLDPPEAFKPEYATHEFPEFQEFLRHNGGEKFTVRKIDNNTTIEIRVQLPKETLRLETTVKRLESRTTVIFIWWMIGATSVFLLVAVIFLRNQIRPIRRLAEAADNFGRGVDMPDFRPSGANEVRRAARAFIVMRERIKRQIRTRTDMLSGISHDLRTPLTRMKLQLAMLGEKEGASELRADVQQMEHMIGEYLDFARGEGGEEAVRTPLRDLLEDVVRDYQRLNSKVTFAGGEMIFTSLRVSAFRRVLHNLIDNALRYGKSCTLTLRRTVNYCEILIDDEGPGIPEDKREDVFKPFNRLDPSRNIKTGGVGLGLTIARDVVLAHGGAISLETSPSNGLRVIIRLPL